MLRVKKKKKKKKKKKQLVCDCKPLVDTFGNSPVPDEGIRPLRRLRQWGWVVAYLNGDLVALWGVKGRLTVVHVLDDHPHVSDRGQ